MNSPLVTYLREPFGIKKPTTHNHLFHPNKGVTLFATKTISESINLLRIIYSKSTWVTGAVPTAFTVTTVHAVLSPLVAGLMQSLLIKGDWPFSGANKVRDSIARVIAT